MIAAARGEALRAASGLTLLAVCMLALLIPVVVLTSDSELGRLAEYTAEAATVRVFQPLAWTFVTAAFAGAYAVTREYYYLSMDRSLSELGFHRAFWSKTIGGVAFSLVLTIGVCVIWSVAAHAILILNDLDLVFSVQVWRIMAGALLCTAIGAVMGGSVGWIAKNYYVAAGVVLALPLAAELMLLRTAPEIARFSPGLTLAALSVPGYRGELLAFPTALLLCIVWTALLTAAAWGVARRRMS
ncbi:MAG: ABC transporter permease [Microbacterium sp.]